MLSIIDAFDAGRHGVSNAFRGELGQAIAVVARSHQQLPTYWWATSATDALQYPFHFGRGVRILAA
jgi:hypothetical protein